MHRNLPTRSIVLLMHGVGDGRVLAYSDARGPPAFHAKIEHPLHVVDAVSRRGWNCIDGYTLRVDAVRSLHQRTVPDRDLERCAARVAGDGAVDGDLFALAVRLARRIEQ